MSKTDLAVKKQYRVYLMNALRRHFKLSKEEMAEDVDIDNEAIIGFPALEQYDFRHAFYVGHFNKLENAFDPVKFSKSNLYFEFINGESQLDPKYVSSYIFAVHINGTLFVMYRASEYSGPGAIYVSDLENYGYVIEPINNFLTSKYPEPQ